MIRHTSDPPVRTTRRAIAAAISSTSAVAQAQLATPLQLRDRDRSMQRESGNLNVSGNPAYHVVRPLEEMNPPRRMIELLSDARGVRMDPAYPWAESPWVP